MNNIASFARQAQTHLQTIAGADRANVKRSHVYELMAAALGLGDQVGQLSVGHQLDAIWLRPSPGTTLDVALRHARSPEDALAKAFALGTPADVAGAWVAGAALARSVDSPLQR